LRPGSLEVSWVESGGPKIGRPTTRGYGTRVITTGIESQLGGSVDFDWNNDGLRCTLSIPRDGKSAPLKRFEDGQKAKGDRGKGGKAATPNLVLLVEDEPLVAMMLADLLTELGHMVDGPHSRLTDAIGAARKSDIQAGVLDVNLGGDSIYGVAEILSAREIPFVFVTGYGADSIDRRFAHIPVLQKPIERQKLQAALSGMTQPEVIHESRAASSA
jgi:CheY-like chemotaxis protein